jgi:hypothetical protein
MFVKFDNYNFFRLFKISNLFSKILQLRKKLCESNANLYCKLTNCLVFVLYLAKEIFSGSFSSFKKMLVLFSFWALEIWNTP